MTRQRMNMAEVCRTTLEELQVAFPERQLLFDAQGDTWGQWDPDRVAQVLSNLVFNALQHGQEDTPVRTPEELIAVDALCRFAAQAGQVEWPAG